MSRSTISTSKKLITIQRIENLSRDAADHEREYDQRQRRGNARAGRQRQKCKIQRSPGQHRTSARQNKPGSVNSMKAERNKMDNGDRTDAQLRDYVSPPTSRCWPR